MIESDVEIAHSDTEDSASQSDANILASDGEFAERLEFMLDTTISEMPIDFEPSDVSDADNAV